MLTIYLIGVGISALSSIGLVVRWKSVLRREALLQQVMSLKSGETFKYTAIDRYGCKKYYREIFYNFDNFEKIVYSCESEDNYERACKFRARIYTVKETPLDKIQRIDKFVL